MKKKYLSLKYIVITLIIGIILGVWQIQPPRVDKSSDIYPAYERMMANLQQFAAAPRPSGSAENAIVRAKMLSEIEDMGLTPIIQDTVFTLDEMIEKLLLDGGVSSMDEFWEMYHDLVAEYHDIYSLDDFIDYLGSTFDEDGNIPLHNIIVKLDAPNTDRGVLFVAHYDSVPKGPGVSDDMLGVVSLLESIRSQAQNNILENDLYFLLTDGEESGKLGANKFVAAYPELKNKIDLVINIDSLGNHGSLMLYQTSPNAYRMVEFVKKSGAWPYGYSVGAEVHSLMASDSDLTEFLNEGYNGLNFAAVGGSDINHTMEDNYENLSHDTAWHCLQTTLSLTDYAANNSLADLQKPSREAVFFPFLPGVMVLMTDIVSHFLCAIACALALIVGVLKLKNKQLELNSSTILMSLLIFVSIICSIFFVAGGYLFYIPLLLFAITSLVKKWPKAHISAKMISGIIVLMLWVPAFVVTWETLVVQMML
jgi:Predicted aminopeptidases